MAKIVWIDLELTGLDICKNEIMKIVCLITDDNLNILAEHPEIVIHQPNSLLQSIDDWCQTSHAKVKYLQKIYFNRKKTILRCVTMMCYRILVL